MNQNNCKTSKASLRLSTPPEPEINLNNICFDDLFTQSKDHTSKLEVKQEDNNTQKNSCLTGALKKIYPNSK